MKLRSLTTALASAFAIAGLGLTTQLSHAAITSDVIRIGFATDMSGLYADTDGPMGAEAIRMAIADAGGAIDGKKIELLVLDHQNKPDIAASKVREWFDQQKIDVLIGGSNSAVTLAMSPVATEKQKPFLAVGAGSSDISGKYCTPYMIHYAYDTTALARGTAAAVLKSGGKDWFFITADYAFGHALERDAANVVKAGGGSVKGAVRVPLSSADFSSYLLQAQGSGAKILGLANAGGDTINSIKAANEFGVAKTMGMAGLLVYVNDIHALGLEATQGMYLTDFWYWNSNDQNRAFTKRFQEKFPKNVPNMNQMGDYSAVSTYLKAVKETHSVDTDVVMKWMKSNKINDIFATNGYIRPEDGRMIHDMKLMQVKKPSESKGPWDFYNVVADLKGEDIFGTLVESACPLVKK
jgi:branched-chain amino acid transport system substrate-binding protein